MGSSKGGSTQATDEEKYSSHLEVSKGDPLRPAYYDKDGLRIDGDSEDHDHEPPVSVFSFLKFPYPSPGEIEIERRNRHEGGTDS